MGADERAGSPATLRVLEPASRAGGMLPACTGLPGDPGCISVENLLLIQLCIDDGMSP
jgi:hypothetical protein